MSESSPPESSNEAVQLASEAPAAPTVATTPAHGFWERLRQHKVAQWTLAYAAAAYTLLHGAEMVSNALHWPELAVRITLALLILGLPITMLLAWYHGHHAQRRISGPELAMLTVLLFIAGTILWVVSRSSSESVPASVAVPTAKPTNAAAAPRTAIAVMPFSNLTGDATKDFLGDGMAEELINTLTKVPGLKVPARTSTFAYKGRGTDIRQIARDLGVGTVLEGSVRSAGTTLRITAQLINAEDGLHLWSETYDRKFTDLFKLQDDLALAIVQALQVNLKGAAPASVSQAPPTQDLEAYQLYLQGSSLADRISEQNLNRATGYFQQAIARDPKFARAYAGLASTYGRQAQSGRQAVENWSAAERAARQALALNPNEASARSILAAVNVANGNWMEAEVHSQASVALGGDDAYVRNARGIHLARFGHARDALAEIHRAVELAPVNPLFVANLATGYLRFGRYAEAMKYADLAAELGSTREFGGVPAVYGDAALRAGRYAEATEIAVKALNVSDPEWARTAEVIKLVYAALANPAQRATAMAAVGRLYAPTTAKLTDVGPCLGSAYRYTLLGALDAAYALANQCLDRMAPGAIGRVGPWAPYLLLRPFRQDPRFQALATRMGFMEYWQKYGPPDDCDLKDGKLTCH